MVNLHERDVITTEKNVIAITCTEIKPDQRTLFFQITNQVFKQLKTAQGLLEQKFFKDGENVFITVSMWDTHAHMKTFSTTAAHQNAMRSASLCSIRTQSIQYGGSILPITSHEAREKLREYQQHHSAQ